MTVVRAGSYPLMALAHDFGVDYGDVLILAGDLRARIIGEQTLGRYTVAVFASGRITAALGLDGLGALVRHIEDHACARWQAPKP